MIVGGYILHLYCDKENGAHVANEFPHEYASEFGSNARKHAKRDGWILKRDGTAICPKCSKLTCHK